MSLTFGHTHTHPSFFLSLSLLSSLFLFFPSSTLLSFLLPFLTFAFHALVFPLGNAFSSFYCYICIGSKKPKVFFFEAIRGFMLVLALNTRGHIASILRSYKHQTKLWKPGVNCNDSIPRVKSMSPIAYISSHGFPVDTFRHIQKY